jgi:hypothetical protein
VNALPPPALRAWLALGCTAVALGGCGFDVQSPDDFLLTRTGEGSTLTLEVNDGGTVRCNGGNAKQISNALLLQARGIVTDLTTDAKAKLHLPLAAHSVFSYTVRMQDGTITFPDTAAGTRHELSEVESFALQTAQGPCGLGS